MTRHPAARRAVVAVAGLTTILATADAQAWQARTGGVRSLEDRGPRVVADGRGDFFSIAGGGVVKYRGTTGKVVWRVALEPNVERDFSRVSALAVDQRGDVVVAGSLPADDRTKPDAYDAVAFKLSGANGRVLWRSRPFPTEGSDSSAGPVAADRNGDVVVLAQQGSQYFAAKLDRRNGAAVWTTPLTDKRGIGLRAFLLRIDAAGRIVVAGDYPDPQLRRTTYTVAGLDSASGGVRWQWMIESATDDVTRTLAVAPDGTVVAATTADSPSGTTDALVVALDAATGAPRWQRRLDSGASDYALALAIDDVGSVFVSGYSSGSGGTGAFVIALDADGADRWRFVPPPETSTSVDFLGALDHAAGVLFVGGSFGGTLPESASFATIAVDPATGRERWRIEIPKDPDVYGSSFSSGVVAVAPRSVVLTGVVDTADTRDDDFLLRVDAETGVETWRILQNDTTATNDTAVAVAIDPRDDVVVAGSIGTPTQETDVIVVKYDGDDGRELWRASIDGELPFESGEFATTAATDGKGDVFVVGRLFNYDRRFPGLPGVDSTVVKLDGRDGTELWRRSFLAPNGVPVGAMRVDPEGDVILAGRLDDRHTASVVRLDGHSGADLWTTALVESSSAAAGGDGTGTVHATSETQAYLLEQDGAGGIVAVSGSLVTTLDPADGRIVWQTAPASFFAAALALDQNGNVLLAGFYNGLRALKLAAHDGRELWRAADTAADFRRGSSPVITADPSGNALVALNAASPLRPGLAATKLDSQSGATRWTRMFTDRLEGLANAVATTDGGDLVVAGWLESVAGVREFAVVRLRGASGTTVWQRRIDSSAGENAAVAIALDSTQNVVAAGTTFDPGSGQDVTTIKLDGNDGRLSTRDGRDDCPSRVRLPTSRGGSRTAGSSPAEPCRRLAR